ncbi:MAG: quinolinate synthase NadA [Helicobacter sp.]|uniref:quinolinate synthase NadA n=1 Tax=Helicobacter sp. 10-6591 TaxID=2004998 RepID=UPI000DCE759E|nr:quinolinate synthase NadA [Helicobacter sp. 10-6591]MCI6218117.1 quinolinate synthase NadA [Helicobacter sp.]MCI7485487.1 quinolinate synthase NadA [Helicobacter sp.]MDD7567018.1 quinolinate synthase NadA [Helicobacter sp.]MDY5740764.1 quinolinate synthase NadA [Helicobacter sp.]RAX55385.1 quinolinate synthetase [Helicobacter sp. 10-6591]
MTANTQLKTKIKELTKKLDALLVAHYYQRDEIVEIADLCGDSLELSSKASQSQKNLIVFCGVAFMGQSVKVLAPNKRVIMPKMACCSMARMIDSEYFDKSIELLQNHGINQIFPITYINSNADVKAKVAKMGGLVCTSANAKKIFDFAKTQGKKIFFLPDKCLGQNLATIDGKSSCVLGNASKEEILESDVVCYDGFCSVHQLFSVKDIEFYRQRFQDIKIVVHPECAPEVVNLADFVGSTSQIIKYVRSLPLEQKVAVGTEFNLVNRLRPKLNGINTTFVLSSTKPECPTMNETNLRDLLDCLLAYEDGAPINEIKLDNDTQKWAKIALDRMLELS